MCNLLLGQNGRDAEYMSFSQVLRNSLSVEKTTPAFCETCKKFTPTNQYARVTELPQILSINCGLKNEKEMTFLKRQLNRNSANGSMASDTSPAPPTSSTPIKPCRYGINCSRVDCHFAHSDRKSPATNSINNSSINTSNTNGQSRSNIWFPHYFTMEIDESNELKIQSDNDTADEPTSSIKSVEKTIDELNISDSTIKNDESEIKEEGKDEDEEIIDEIEKAEKIGEIEKVENTVKKSYKLTAIVCQVINGNQRNLVALVSVGEKYHKVKMCDFDPSSSAQWYIFNDFR